MNKDRFMDVTGDNFTIDKRPQKVLKDADNDQTASHPSFAQLRPYANNKESLRNGKRSESADFSDNMIIRPSAFNHSNSNHNGVNSSSDLYSPQRKFDLESDEANRATTNKFNPYNEKQTSHTITPNDGYSVDNNDLRDQQSYLQTLGQRINYPGSPQGYEKEDIEETLSKNEGSPNKNHFNAVKGGLLPPIIG